MERSDILFHDSALVAVNKPAGLLVHRSEIDRHETRFALQIVRDQLGQRVYPVHRLDKPTSGVLLFALSSDIARAVTEQFTAGEVRKRYLGVVRGIPDSPFVIDNPLRENRDKMTDHRARQNKAPQSAITALRTLASAELPVRVDRYPTSRYALVEARPHTGRKHQIRRHLKHISHPLIGDTTYGKSGHNRLFSERFDCRRLLLHADQLALRHPETGAELIIRAPLDAVFASVIQALGWAQPTSD